MDRRERNLKWYHHFDEKRMTATIEGGDGEDVEVPVVFEVCGTCDGKGSHVNPSIDSNGLSREDFDEDPDFAEAYFEGRYDVQCNECDGRRVVPVVDEARASMEQVKYVHDKIEADAQYEAECAAERRMGA